MSEETTQPSIKLQINRLVKALRGTDTSFNETFALAQDIVNRCLVRAVIALNEPDRDETIRKNLRNYRASARPIPPEEIEAIICAFNRNAEGNSWLAFKEGDFVSPTSKIRRRYNTSFEMDLEWGGMKLEMTNRPFQSWCLNDRYKIPVNVEQTAASVSRHLLVAVVMEVARPAMFPEQPEPEPYEPIVM